MGNKKGLSEHASVIAEVFRHLGVLYESESSSGDWDDAACDIVASMTESEWHAVLEAAKSEE